MIVTKNYSDCCLSFLILYSKEKEKFLSYDVTMVIMKWVISLLILLLLVVNVNAITMGIGSSYYTDGKNTTLVSIDYPQKFATFCVNGEKRSIYFIREEIHTFNGINLDIFDSSVSFIKLRINPVEPCPDCYCGKECSNLACYNKPLPSCYHDLDCNDNKTETNDRCLKNKCFNELITPIEEEKLEEKEDVVESFSGVKEEKSINFTFLLTILLIIIILGVIGYFAYTRKT